MPLPISSQIFMPNPLAELQAAQIGKQVGSPWGNFLEGALTGYQTGLDIQEQQQKIELQPREQARRERETDLEEQRLGVLQKTESRLQDAFQWDKQLDEQKLELQRDQLELQRENVNSQMRTRAARLSLAKQDEAEKAIVQGAVNDAIIDGNVDSIDAILADPKRKNAGALTRYMTVDPLGNAAVRNIEDAIRDGRVTGDSALRLGSYLETLKHSSKLTTSAEVAEKTAIPILQNVIGYRPPEDSLLDIRKHYSDESMKMSDGWSIYAIDKNGDEKKIGYIPEGTPEKTIQALFPSIGAYNNSIEMRRQLQQSVAQTAELKARAEQATSQATQPELPTKISRESRTPTQKLGTNRASQTIPMEESNIGLQIQTKSGSSQESPERQKKIEKFQQKRKPRNFEQTLSDNPFRMMG